MFRIDGALVKALEAEDFAYALVRVSGKFALRSVARRMDTVAVFPFINAVGIRCDMKDAERLSGMPGVESVTKQFLYQAAYRDFVLAHGFSRVVNAFLVPSCGDSVEHLGRVRFPGVIAAEELPFSNEVELYALPAEAVFDAYVGGRELDTARLAEVIG